MAAAEMRVPAETDGGGGGGCNTKHAMFCVVMLVGFLLPLANIDSNMRERAIFWMFPISPSKPCRCHHTALANSDTAGGDASACQWARPHVVIGFTAVPGKHFKRVDCILNTWMFEDIPASLGSVEVVVFNEGDAYPDPQELACPRQVTLEGAGYPPNEHSKRMWEWFAKERPDADFYMKVDSDTYVFTTQLMMFLKSQIDAGTDMEHFWSGCCGTEWVSGAAYILSKEVAQHLVANSTAWWNCYPRKIDDVSMGKCVNLLTNSRALSNPQFYFQWPDKAQFREQKWLNRQAKWQGDLAPISFHHLNAECFEHLYQTSERLKAEGIHNVIGSQERRAELNVSIGDLLDAYGEKCSGNGTRPESTTTYRCPQRLPTNYTLYERP